LTQLDDEELQHELVDSRKVVAEHTGMWPEYFAYPYGLWDRRVELAVRAAGYRAR